MGWVALVLGIALFVIFLARFPRQTLAGAAGIIAILVAFVWKEHSDTARWNKSQEGLVLVVAHDPLNCSQSYLAVGFQNQTGRAVEKVSWRFEARQPGFSNNLVSGYHAYESDKILHPGDTHTLCYIMPQLSQQSTRPESLEWSVSNKYVTFRK